MKLVSGEEDSGDGVFGFMIPDMLHVVTEFCQRQHRASGRLSLNILCRCLIATTENLYFSTMLLTNV